MKSTFRYSKLAMAIGVIVGQQVAFVSNGYSEVLEEVVVTAQKRSERLQDVPITVTAFSGKALDELGVLSSGDVAAYTPNLTWRSEFGYTTPQVFLRGIGNNTFHAYGVSPVGIYADGVYMGSNLTHGFNLYDLERVEVLKGPQGTLYGRNTTGGLVNFIARKPSVDDGTSGNVSVTYGRFNQRDVEAAVGFPINDELSARFSLSSNDRDGIFDNNNPDSGITEAGNTDAKAWRAQLRYTPSDRIDINLKINGGKNDSDLRPFKNIGTTDGFFGPCSSTPSLGNPDCSTFFAFTDSDDIYESFDGFRTMEKLDSLGASLSFDYHADNFTFTSITAHHGAERMMLEDTDHSPIVDSHGSYDADYNQFSQEIRFTSSSDGDLEWMVGAFFYQDSLESWEGFASNDYFNLFAIPGFYTNFLAGLPTPGANEEAIGTLVDQETTSYSTFGEAKYAINDQLSVTLGLRWTYDERDADMHSFTYDAAGIGSSFSNFDAALARHVADTIAPTNFTDEWREWSGRVVLDYALSDDILLFGGFSRGFKGGELSAPLLNINEAGIVDPEFVNSWEGGIKSTLLDGTMRLNASAFIYDFKDQQVALLLPDPDGSGLPISTLSNAGQSTIKGVEIDFQYTPDDNWFIQMGVGLLDATFDRFERSATESFSGNKIASSPDTSVNTLIRRDWPLTDGSNFSLQADAVYTDEQFFTADNNPVVSEDAYTIWGARAAWMSADDKWEVSLWGKNLGGKEYFSAVFDLSALGFYSATVGNPRTFGATVNYNFSN